MKILIILTFTVLTIFAVELTRRNQHKKRIGHSHSNLTVKNYLRTDGDMPHLTPYDFLELDGSIRAGFIYDIIANEENVATAVCSPFSALMPLGILLLGAGNRATEKNLRKAIGIHRHTNIHEYFEDLQNKISNLPSVTTYLANRLYINDKKKLKSSFKEKAEATFKSSIQSVNMEDGFHVAEEVNEWVRKNTMGKIDNILEPMDVKPKTAVVVVDAMYFSAPWKHIFENEIKKVFHGINGDQEVNFMTIKEYYMYGTSNVLGVEAIIIPYEGEAAAMLVLLPHERDGLHSLIWQLKLAPELINGIIMEPRYVNLQLPSFKIETTLDLKHLYEMVGLYEIFQDGHGLHDMVKNETLLIDKGVQKTVIEVTKEGTVAAAASVVNAMMLSAGIMNTETPLLFRADHPFLFFIIAHRQQLFGGTFAG